MEDLDIHTTWRKQMTEWEANGQQGPEPICLPDNHFNVLESKLSHKQPLMIIASTPTGSDCNFKANFDAANKEQS